jgi:hypothetical protein
MDFNLPQLKMPHSQSEPVANQTRMEPMREKGSWKKMDYKELQLTMEYRWISITNPWR